VPLYHRVAGTWQLAEPAATPGGGTDQIAARDALTYGAYEPTGIDTNPADATTGVPSNITLTAYNDPSTDKLTLPAGTVITEKIIYGDITPQGSLTLNRCLLVGGLSNPTTDVGVVTCTGNRTGQTVLRDCTIKPRVEANGRNGIQGRQWEAYRCDISGVIDGMGIFSTVVGTPANVTALGNYVHDLVYVFPDTITTSHTDGTHNDCIQYQGGRLVTVRGNRIRATSHAKAGTGTNPDKPWLIGTGNANGAGIIVQRNTGDAADQSVIFEQNFLSNGLSHLNGKATAPSYVYRNNQHYRATATNVSPPWAGYWMRFDAGMVLADITGAEISNKWIDGPYAGQLLAVGGDHGILIG
jgi:hypothetical protein